MKVNRIFTWCLTLLLPACGSGVDSMACVDDFAASSNEVAVETAVPEADNSQTAVVPAASWPAEEQKIIRRARLNIEVANLERAKRQVDSLVRAHQGFVLSDRFEQIYNRATHNIEIRVAAQLFDTLLGDLGNIAQRVVNQIVSTDDVTEEYIDIQARIHNRQKVERTFLRLLNRATTVDEILKIETELGNIRAEIESVQGRLQYLENRVNFSTIMLNMHQDLPKMQTASQTFGARVKHALELGYHGIGWLIVALLAIWPLWIVAIAIVLIIKYLRKHPHHISDKSKTKKAKSKNSENNNEKDGKKEKYKKNKIFDDKIVDD